MRVELRAGLARLKRGGPNRFRGLGGNIGDFRRGSLFDLLLLLLLGDAPIIHDKARPVLAQDLLHAADGVAIVVEQEADAAEKRARPRGGNSAGRRRASSA